MTLKICSLIEYQVKNIFMEESCRKFLPKTSPRPLFNFGKEHKTARACKKFFLKYDILKEDYQKALKKSLL